MMNVDKPLASHFPSLDDQNSFHQWEGAIEILSKHLGKGTHDDSIQCGRMVMIGEALRIFYVIMLMP